MQSSTSAVSSSWSQALKKSACMVEAAPDESVTVPDVVGTRNLTSMVSVATGFGWVSGHCLVPSPLLTAPGHVRAVIFAVDERLPVRVFSDAVGEADEHNERTVGAPRRRGR